MAPVSLSPLDTGRFGFVCARAHVTSANLQDVLLFCRDQSVRLLIARCDAADLAAAQAMERAGFQLMDTLVYCQCDLIRSAIPEDFGHIAVRPFREGEADAVVSVAEASFTGYISHYHADPRIASGQATAIYGDWARRSCLDRTVAEAVLVGDLEGEVAGFITLRMNSPREGEVLLSAVHRKEQGQGLYRSLLVAAMGWCAERGARRTLVSTQLANVYVQGVWSRLGFEPLRAEHTFHHWLLESSA